MKLREFLSEISFVADKTDENPEVVIEIAGHQVNVDYVERDMAEHQPFLDAGPVVIVPRHKK